MNSISKILKLVIFGISLLTMFVSYADELPSQKINPLPLKYDDEIPKQIYLMPTARIFQVNLPFFRGYRLRLKNYDHFYFLPRAGAFDLTTSQVLGTGIKQYTFEVIYRAGMPKFTVIVFSYLKYGDDLKNEVDKPVTVIFQIEGGVAN